MIEPNLPGPFKVHFCRICEHTYGTHNSNGCMKILGEEPKMCDCKEYITKDNLKYLEWLYEKEKL